MSTIQVDDRCSLSPFEPRDKAALLVHLSEKEIYDNTLRIPYPYTEEDAEEWFELVKEQAEQGMTVSNWAIRDSQGNLIGGLGFGDLYLGETYRSELGYWLAKPYWGQGMMTKLVAAACDYAFREWNLMKITAHVFEANLASQRVLQKVGFQQEGLLRDHYWKDEKIFNAVLFGLLKREWIVE